MKKLEVNGGEIYFAMLLTTKSIQPSINDDAIVNARNAAKEFKVRIKALEVDDHSHDIITDECGFAFRKYLLQDYVQF